MEKLTKIAFGLGMALGVLTGLPAHAAPMSAADIFERASANVMVVRALNENESPIRQGSGVITGAKTIVTNCHVIAKAKLLQVRQGGISYQATLEFADIDRDLCQLSVPDLRPPATATSVSSATLKVGQRVFTIGAPNGREFAMSDGIVYGIGISSDTNALPIEITSTIPNGVSGGGIFDEMGKLVGIASASTARTSIKGHGLASPAAWIAELPVRAKARQATEQSTAQPTTAGTAPPPPANRKLAAEELRKAIARSAPFTIGQGGPELRFTSGGWWTIDLGRGDFPRQGHSSVSANAQVCIEQTVPASPLGMRYTGCFDAEQSEGSQTIVLLEKDKRLKQ